MPCMATYAGKLSQLIRPPHVTTFIDKRIFERALRNISTKIRAGCLAAYHTDLRLNVLLDVPIAYVQINADALLYGNLKRQVLEILRNIFVTYCPVMNSWVANGR